MKLDFSQNGVQMIFDVTEDGTLMLSRFSCREGEDTRSKKPQWCTAVELHVCGENPDDHHFAKHTGSSGCWSLKYVSHQSYPTEDGSKLEFLLADETLKVTAHYQFYTGIAVVRAWTTVECISDEPVGLEYVSSFAYTGFDEGKRRANDKMRVYMPYNAWKREVNWREYSLSELGFEMNGGFSGKRIMQSNTGTWSTKESLPMGAVHNEETKDTLLWQIEHNGSWHWEMSDIRDMMYLKLSGPTEQENRWYRELKKGEVFESAKAAIAVGADFDAALEAMTAYRRKIVSPAGADGGLPVIFNDYMNCLWADPTEEKEIPVIDRAAEVGAEYYCMDAGWYADGTWWETVGEWQPCAWRFPNGIHKVFDYVRQKGMVPGIWLEIEVMGIQCPLAKEFEDECFFMRHGKRVIDHGRYQLDFRHPKVRAFATAVIDRVVNEYGVGYIKNDYNIEAGVGTEVGSDSIGDGLMGHNRAFLAWLKEMRERHPALVFESCASGGTRMDYAMLSVAQLQSVSDQTNYKNNAHISAAASTAVLPEQAAIWAYPMACDDADGTAMNMVNALLQRIHLSGGIMEWSDEQRALVKEAVALYKTIRADIPTAIPFYPLGIPKYTDQWLVSAYRCTDCVRMAVWRMDTDEEAVRIPLPKAQGRVRVLYPSAFDCSATYADGGVKVTLPRRFTAVVIEVR